MNEIINAAAARNITDNAVVLKIDISKHSMDLVSLFKTIKSSANDGAFHLEIHGEEFPETINLLKSLGYFVCFIKEENKTIIEW